MSIWFKAYTLEDLKEVWKDTMLEHLSIDFVEIGENFLKGRMPVDHRTKQAYGILHGGASAAMAETLGSVGSNMVVDQSKYTCVGMEINSNHLRPAKDGYVFGIAKPFHLGKRNHVWGIEITNEEGKQICVSRLTIAVVEKFRIT